MNIVPFSELVGVLNVTSTLVILDDGFYSVDGNPISTDTIGPQTQITAAAGASITITLNNSAEVSAKLVSVPGGNLTVNGTGSLYANNQDITELSRITGVRVYRDINISGGATLTGVGLHTGVTAVNSNAIGITVSGGSTLIGRVTGINTSILNAAKYGVQSSRGITITDGSRVEGYGDVSSYNTYGIQTDSAHLNYPLHVVNGEVIGTAETGVYVGGPLIVDSGRVIGTGGSYSTSHGVQADRTGITVNPAGEVIGTCSGNGYAGVIATTTGITVNGGRLTGTGGIHGVRVAGTGELSVTDGGTLTGIGTSYGVIVLYNSITVNNGRVSGTTNTTAPGSRAGVFAGSDITVSDGVVEGFIYTYGLDGSGYYGAVIAEGTISASDDSQIIENYYRVEYFDETFQIPYQNGKNMTSYLDYGWAISAGTGAVASDPGGLGIHATQSGSGTLTATRTGYVPAEVVVLDADSTHIINIPVVLTVTPPPTFRVIYNGNGATAGAVPNDINEYEAGDTVIVFGNIGNLVREGFVFAGWTFDPAGADTILQGGNIFIMPANNVTLYARWIPYDCPPCPPCPPEQPCPPCPPIIRPCCQVRSCTPACPPRCFCIPGKCHGRQTWRNTEGSWRG